MNSMTWMMTAALAGATLAHSQPSNPTDDLITAIWESRGPFGTAPAENGRAKRLLERIVDVNKTGGHQALKVTALMAAAEKGNTEMVRLLIAKGADVNVHARDGSTALFYAADANRTTLKDQTELVQLLLQRGAEPNAARELDGATPIMAAAKNINAAAIRELVAHGAKVDVEGKSGITALTLALSYSFSSGVSDSIPEKEKLKAMEEAKLEEAQARRSRVDTVQALISSGADVNHRNAAGLAALHFAVIARPADVEVMKVIVDAGADVNATTTEGRTPLMLAAEQARLDSVSFLVQRGANLEAKDKEGMTALRITEIAKKYVNARAAAETADLLKSAGAK